MPRDIIMKQLRIVAAVCAFSLSMAQVKAEDRFLVDEGKTYAEIIVSESPARSTRLTAAEMQTCVAKISGARLSIGAEPSLDVPVQIYAGESPHAVKLGVTADCLEDGVSSWGSSGDGCPDSQGLALISSFGLLECRWLRSITWCG